MTLVLGDTETTGIGPSARVVEIAGLVIDEDLNVLEEFGTLINPGIPIPAGASAIHGITDEMVQSQPTIEQFKSSVAQSPIQLLAYNSRFDLPFFQQAFNVQQDFCILKLARSLNLPTENNKLQTLREHFGFEANAAHRALDDCKITLQVLRELLKISGRSLQDHIGTKPHMLSIMPMGEHKGKSVMDVPLSYRNWVLKQPDMDVNLRFTFETINKML